MLVNYYTIKRLILHIHSITNFARYITGKLIGSITTMEEQPVLLRFFHEYVYIICYL